MGGLLVVAFYGLMIVLVIFSLVGILLFLFPLRPSRKAQLQDVSSPLTLDPVSGQYLQNVSYDNKTNELIFLRKSNTGTAVVSVATKSGKKRRINLYVLDFSDGDAVIIPLNNAIESYVVVVERVNGRRVKPALKLKQNQLIKAGIYCGISAGINCLALFSYIFIASSFLKSYFAGYVGYYNYVFFGLIGPVAAFAAFVLIGVITNSVLMKGGK